MESHVQPLTASESALQSEVAQFPCRVKELEEGVHSRREVCHRKVEDVHSECDGLLEHLGFDGFEPLGHL